MDRIFAFGASDAANLITEFNQQPLTEVAGNPLSGFARGRESRLGRMFPLNGDTLRAHPASSYHLRNLGLSFDRDSNAAADDAPVTPAGMTFLAQFIEHDITLESTTRTANPGHSPDSSATRVPGLDLACIYGSGPDTSPQLYEQTENGIRLRRGAVLEHRGIRRHDLPRMQHPDERTPRLACIADPRNDDNIVLAQLHAAWAAFHNKLADNNPELPFDDIRAAVVHYYHRVIMEEFLPAIAGPQAVRDIEVRGRRFYFRHGMVDPCTGLAYSPFLPVEFSVAAFRFGHAQMRQDYDINVHETGIPLAGCAKSLTGFRSLDRDLMIHWQNFFDFEGSRTRPQKARKINTKLAPALLSLPAMPPGASIDPADLSLAVRTLVRGRIFRLPSGETVAKAIGVEPVPMEARVEQDFSMTETPLWPYLLHEAAETQNGDHLGPAGAVIVAEVIHGLLESYRARAGASHDTVIDSMSRNDNLAANTDAARVKQHKHGGRDIVSMQSIIEYAYPAEFA